MTTAADRTVNMAQAVAAEDVSRRTLYYWMAAGRLPFRIVRGHRIVNLADVAALKRSNATRRETRNVKP